MFRVSSLLGLGILAVALAVGVGTTGETKKDKDKDKTKGMLPAGWKALNLSLDQKAKVYKIQGDYKSKIKELRDKIADLEAKEKTEMAKVLTTEQREHLLKITVGEDTKEKKDKAPPPKDGNKDKE